MKTLPTLLAVALLAAVSIPATAFTVTNTGGQTSRSHIRAIPEGGGAGARHKATECNVHVRFHPTRACVDGRHIDRPAHQSIFDRWGNMRGRNE